MKEFGKQYYDDVFYFNFDEEEELSSVFQKNKNSARIIELLGMIRGKKIEPGKHLIIFDEVQECPDTLNSLKKYIAKKHPKLAVRYSLLNYKEQETLVNIPLYLINKMKEYI